MIAASNIFKTIVLLGAIQGIIVGFLLFFATRQRVSNRLLAVLIWLMALASLDLYGYQTGFFYSSTFMSVFHALVPMILAMPIGPLLYFYVQACLDPGFRMGKKRRKYFYPVILDIMPQLAALVYITGVLTGVIKKAIDLGYYIDVYDTYVDIPRWLSLTIYVWLAARHLSSFKKNNAVITGQQQVNIKWLQQFIRVFQVFQVTWFIYLVPYVIPRYTNWMVDTFQWYPVYIPLAVLIYWLGIKGYIVAHLQAISNKKNSGTDNRLPEDVILQTVAALKTAMEKDKLYLNPSLNLAMLGQHTGIAQKVISAVLNQHLHKSFSEYINESRVEEFKRKILEPGLGHLTITGIAFECGFNSQATFQRIFKQVTGMSPSEYRLSRSAT